MYGKYKAKISNSVYENKIGDYYTSLTTDKRFVFLDTAEWDLKDNHSIPVVLDEDEEINLAKTKKHDISVVVDRIVVRLEDRSRIFDSLETALERFHL